MGWNTTLVILNDTLHEIKDDPKFGEKVYHAVLAAGCHIKAEDVVRFDHGAKVINCNHSHDMALIAVGGNTGKVVSHYAGSYDATDEQMLRAWADKMGFDLRKKPAKKKR